MFKRAAEEGVREGKEKHKKRKESSGSKAFHGAAGALLGLAPGVILGATAGKALGKRFLSSRRYGPSGAMRGQHMGGTLGGLLGTAAGGHLGSELADDDTEEGASLQRQMLRDALLGGGAASLGVGLAEGIKHQPYPNKGLRAPKSLVGVLSALAAPYLAPKIVAGGLAAGAGMGALKHRFARSEDVEE